MNKAVVVKYLKQDLKRLPIRVLIFLLLFFLVQNKDYAFGYLLLCAVGLILDFIPFSKRELYLKDLEKKGLTEEEINNTEFIKHWEENRERGLLKYCLIDGGVIAGALFSVAISLIWIFVFSTNSQPFADGPGEIFEFIGITYLAGAIVGAIVYRINWRISENKYARLNNSSH